MPDRKGKAAVEKFVAAGTGPFFKPNEAGGMGDYLGEQHPLSITARWLKRADRSDKV
jgi:hypothetical protein